jgi:hypothetical protein
VPAAQRSEEAPVVATGHVTSTQDHIHDQEDVTGLPAALDGKAAEDHDHDADYSAAGHGHAEGDVTGLTAALAGKAATGHNHDASYSAAGHNHTGTYAPLAHNHAAADINSGTFDVARIPTGTSGTTVALGNHTHSDGFGAFTAPTSLGAGVTQRASTGTVGSRLEPGDTVRLRGAIDISGNPASGTVLFTLAAGHRPVGGTIVHPGIRTGPTGNISCVLLINTAGEVTLTAAPGAGAYLGLDGITFVRTVA